VSQDERQEPGPYEAGAAPAAWRDLIDRPVAQAFGLGALVGIVLLGVVWVTFSAVSDDPVSVGRGSVGGTGQAGPVDQSPAAVDRPSGPTPMQRCASVADALGVPLRAAGPAMDQWEVHVGAMNRLVVGALTLQQATAFWAQTRVGAKERIADFRDADRASRRLDVTCPMRRPRSGRSPALRSCVRQVRVDTRALAAARTAVGTWEMHVANMERLRSGKLSPAAATTMWLSMWQQGVREIHDFHVAAREARHESGCYAPAG
jgi:hypothetical protein